MTNVDISSKTSNRIKIILIIIVVISIIFSSMLFAGSLFLKNHYTQKGTLTYYLLIPDFIKNFPVIDPVSEPIYYSIPIDVHPGSNGVSYTTNLDLETLRETLSYELNKRGVYIEQEEIIYDEYILLNRNIPTYLLIMKSDEGGIDIRAYEQY